MKKPLLIFLSLVVAIALVITVGIPMWVSHEERISAIPKSGTYTCEELSASLTFGWPGILTLPDGTTIEFGIDYGRCIMNVSERPLTLDGEYEAHLDQGFVEITFEKLPIPFEPDHPYRFVETTD